MIEVFVLNLHRLSKQINILNDVIRDKYLKGTDKK